MKIGVLSLQGAFAKHAEMLEIVGLATAFVRYPEELKGCSGLIIPGGESTVMTRQIKDMQFLAPLREFAQNFPIFGTCAGMILMAREGILSLLDISVNRNAYGRQSASFITDLNVNFCEDGGNYKTVSAFFIRAPRISQIYSQEVKILAEYESEPVLIQQGFHLAAAFHPELTDDCKIHKYFGELCKIKQSPLQLSKTTHTRSFQTI